MAVLGVGAALFGAGTFFAGVADAVVGVAVSLGISYAAQAMEGKPPPPEAARFSVQGTLQGGGDVPRSFIMGECATAGSLVYGNVWGTSDDGKSPNAYLTQVVSMSDIPVKGMTGILVAGEECTLDTGTVTDKGYPVLEYRKAGADHLWIKFYDGTQTVADPLLVNKVSSPARPYESTRVGVGVAYMIATALVAEELWTGLPTYKAVIDGIRLYDVTQDSTNGGGGAQRFADPATWGGDGDYLPIVQAYNVLRGIRYAGQWMVGLQTSGAATVPEFNWRPNVTKCRTPILGPDGYEPTYISGMQVNVNVPAGQIITALMTACHGKLSEVGGSYKVHCGAPDSIDFEFHDDDLISSEAQTFAPFKTLADSINGITGTYPDPDQGWNTATAPARYSPVDEATDGNRRLLASPSFDAVPRLSQVQRLMESALRAARRERTHVAVFPPRYWLIETGDVGAWTSPRNGYVAKLFEVTTSVDKPNLCTSAGLCEVDPSDYGWNHGSDFLPGTSGPLTFFRPAAQGVSDWNVVGDAVTSEDGLRRRAVARLSWDNDIPGVVGIRWRIRRAGDGEPVTVGSITVPDVDMIYIDQNILSLSDYEMSTQYVPSSPRDMLWSEWRGFTTPDARLTIYEMDAALQRILSRAKSDLKNVIGDISAAFDTIASDLAALTWEHKEEVQTQLQYSADGLSVFIDETKTIAVGVDEALAAYKLAMGARVGDVEADLTQERITRANADGALSASLTTVSTTVGGHTSSLQLLASSVNGNAINLGLVGTIDGVTGGLILQGFKSGGVVTYNIVLDGNVIVPGTITASKTNIGQLSAITGNVGDLTAGTLRSQNNRMKILLDSGRIEIWK